MKRSVGSICLEGRKYQKGKMHSFNLRRKATRRHSSKSMRNILCNPFIKGAAVMSRWDLLPPDIHELILSHRSAIYIQKRWRWFTSCGHTRNPLWSSVRGHLFSKGVPKIVCELARYTNVRREWRTEPASWLLTDINDLEIILEEARSSLWGNRSW